MVIELNELERVWKDKHPNSIKLYEEAIKYTPAGVHHAGMIKFWPTHRGMHPPYIDRAKGQHIWDVDGNMYTDYYSHGALFLGHAHPAVVKAIEEQAALGPFAGDFSEIQVKLVKKVVKMVPCAETVKFCNSGTEATMYAIRIARVYTGREKIIKFAGHFHGCQDQLYTNFLGEHPFDLLYESGGVPQDCYKHTVVIKDGDVGILEEAIRKNNPAAVIFCFSYGSSGCGMPIGGEKHNEFLKALREITKENDVILIADEVITGFRLAPGGGQEYFGIDVDMATLGKMVTGGIAGAGAVVGKREIMAITNPKTHERGKFAETCGTFSGNPMCMAAGYAALDVIDKAEGRLNQYANRLGGRFREELNEVFERYNFPAQAVGCGSTNGVVFTKNLPVKSYFDVVKGSKEEAYKYRLWLMTHAGIYTTGAFFISSAHTDEDMNLLIKSTEEFVSSS